MTSESQKVLSFVKSASDSNEGSEVEISGRVKARQSNELVLAFCGPIGADIALVQKQLEEQLHLANYQVQTIKISDGILELLNEISQASDSDLNKEINRFNSLDWDELNPYEKYLEKQNSGNLLRQIELDILAQYVATKILNFRIECAKPEYEAFKEKNPKNDIELSKYVVDQYIPEKTAYFVDQLKHPAETELLQQIYGQSFYQIGLFSSEENREYFLSQKDLGDVQISRLMDRDKKDDNKHGQQLQETLMLSDYFIKIPSEATKLKQHVTRFMDLIHSRGSITPTIDESSMYAAFSAALGSACLSRQVGSCITNPSGQILATGCNDVPKFGGGLYSADSKNDMRCYNYKGGKCFNDIVKLTIKKQILSILQNQLDKGDDQLNKLANRIYNETGLKDITEYSRAIHAEMAAILHLTQKGGVSTNECTLYVTTFPCHNCARHIVAAGIKKVIYVEPYEKSKAKALHDDSLTIGLESESKNSVVFDHFEGVAPRKFQRLFASSGKKKNNEGIYSPNTSYNLKPMAHQYLDSYRHIELKVASHLNDKKIKP